MADWQTIEAIVDRVISSRLEEKLAELRREVLAGLRAELAPVLESPSPAVAEGDNKASERLNQAVAQLQGPTSQAEVLRTLLDGAIRFSARCALYVLRGNTLAGWQSRGFAHEEALRQSSLETGSGLAGQVVIERRPVSGPAADFDPDLVRAQGAPHDGSALVLPLIVKNRVAAVVYADGGSNGQVDGAALEVLVRAAGVWLDLQALRKSLPAEAEPAEPRAQAASAAASATVQAPTEAFAETQLGAASVPEPAALPPRESAPASEKEAAPAAEPEIAAVAIAAAPTVEAAAPAIAGDEEVHRKAKRFAKLLVDELKLYNQDKVQEGRSNADLYDRLREDIDKSRASYEKRFGGTAAGPADYFTSELIRILADNDVKLLGSNFPK